MSTKPKPILCPHCGKPIRKAPKPRDLGLLLHALTYRVPVEETITEAWIECTRKHSKMKSERLKELRSAAYERFWRYMYDKRDRRLAWFNEEGEIPPYGWTPPKSGEQDHYNAIEGMRIYRKRVAKLKAKLARNPEFQKDKLLNRYFATKRKRSPSRKLAALNDIEARLVLQWEIESGDLTLDDYRELKSIMLPDDYYDRKKKKRVKNGFDPKKK